jgi:hypothetical protein
MTFGDAWALFYDGTDMVLWLTEKNVTFFRATYYEQAFRMHGKGCWPASPVSRATLNMRRFRSVAARQSETELEDYLARWRANVHHRWAVKLATAKTAAVTALATR